DWIQNAIIELNECQQDIKWTTSPKVFVEIALLNIANRYRESESIDNDAIAELQQKVAQLEKQLVTLQKRPELEQRSSSKETRRAQPRTKKRSEEHTSELQSRFDLVCRLLLEKKKK